MKREIYRIENGKIVVLGGGNSRGEVFDFSVDDLDRCYILPGFVDVHVHLREPGFLYKETIRTGTEAAAAGGFTAICSMPNLDPCPDCMSSLKTQIDLIERDGKIRVYPYGAITEGQKGKKLSQMESMKEAIAFTEDGFGVMSDDLMRRAMVEARRLGKLIVAHCEDSRYPRESRESEWKQLQRDLKLVEETGCSYHMCHLSTRESIELIGEAKSKGLDVTCETAPHYIAFTIDDVEKARKRGIRPGRFKMNPPIKGEKDREAIIEGVTDGTIDMFATDHAPHSMEEKDVSFEESAFGIVGLETAFPALYTCLVKEGYIDLKRLVEMMSDEPARRFGIDRKGDFTIWDLDEEWVVNPEGFKTKGRSTPFEGRTLTGRCIKTICRGKEVHDDRKSIEK